MFKQDYVDNNGTGSLPQCGVGTLISSCVFDPKCIHRLYGWIPVIT